MKLQTTLKSLMHQHVLRDKPSVVVFSSPRGGSTWISELIASLPGFWPVEEPFNLRKPVPARELCLSSYADLYAASNLDKVESYYREVIAGRVPEFKLRPGQPHYRPITHRLVIKQNQALLNRIDWFEQTFGIKSVHLIRHPIAVALSREVFPLLPDFHRCELREAFTAEQLVLADRLIESGSHLEQGVLAWCLHHGPALWQSQSSWLLISYEECVVRPDQVLESLANFLNEPDAVERMRRNLSRPSKVMGKSDAETQEMVASEEGRANIVSKWRKKVAPEEEAHLLGILRQFDLDTYVVDEDLPTIGRA